MAGDSAKDQRGSHPGSHGDPSEKGIKVHGCEEALVTRTVRIFPCRAGRKWFAALTSPWLAAMNSTW